MPRDLMMVRVRLRSPPLRTTSSMSHVSMSEEMPTSLCSRSSPPDVRLVKQGGDAAHFRKSMSRVIIERASSVVPMLTRLVIGSTMTTAGVELLDRLVHGDEVHLEPVRGRPDGKT